MKPRSTRSALISLILVSALVGCRHKVVAPPPEPAKTVPPLTPSSITVITPLPSVPQSSAPDVQPAPPVEKPVVVPPPAPVKRKRRLHRKPAPSTDQTPAVAGSTTAPATTTANTAASSATGATTGSATGAAAAAAVPTAPSATSPADLGADKPELTSPPRTAASEAAPTLGQLSAGTTISPADRTRMLRDIDAQETRLSKAHEPKTPDGHAVQLQVRTFLTRARQAVTENDLDGAQTLTTKARVLLDELQSE